MRSGLSLMLIPLLLAGCDSWKVSLSDEKDPHIRTFATIENLHAPESEIAIRKRDRTVMAEKELLRGGKMTTSFVSGRHREHKWMSGILLHYSF